MPPSVFIAVQCKQMLLVLKGYVQICQSVCMAAVISALVKAGICHRVHILDSIISVALALCVCLHRCLSLHVHAYKHKHMHMHEWKL